MAALKPVSQIVSVLGGGGFSMEPDDPLMDDLILSPDLQRLPHVCFLPTASVDSETYIAKFFAAYKSPRAIPSLFAALQTR